MPWSAWRCLEALGAIGLAACAACAGSAGSHDETRRDTLFVGPAVPATTMPAPTIDSARSTSARADTLALRLDAFVGFSRKSGSASLPELAMVAADGRRTGFDPDTRRTLFELPGADYESAPAPDDHDTPPGTPAPVSSEPVIDVRVLDVPAHAGDTYTLMVAATDAGSFVLHVTLAARRGDGSVPVKPKSWEDTDFALRRGEVRRVLVRVGEGTLEVHPDTSAR
jgi:hypothetical protein